MSSAVSSKTFKPNKNLTVTVFDNLRDTEIAFCLKLEEAADRSIIRDGQFRIGVSGGSLVKALGELLPRVRTDFSKWKIFFVDERIVPENDPENTFGLYKQIVIPKTSLTEDNFIKVNTSLSAKDAAVDYENKLREHFPWEYQDPPPEGKYFPRFDCLLLGLGPDGHTCSLFPGHPLLKEKNLWIAPITDSPKPPPQRVTITFPVIHNARNVIMYLTGKGKADIIKRVLLDCEKLPGFFINTTQIDSEVQWFIDGDAGYLLPDHQPLIAEIVPHYYDISEAYVPSPTKLSDNIY